MHSASYITPTIIIIIKKINLNENPKFIDYNTFKKELEKIICVMTGKINYKILDEIINNIDPIKPEMNSNSKDKGDLEDISNLDKDNLKISEESGPISKKELKESILNIKSFYENINDIKKNEFIDNESSSDKEYKSNLDSEDFIDYKDVNLLNTEVFINEIIEKNNIEENSNLNKNNDNNVHRKHFLNLENIKNERSVYNLYDFGKYSFQILNCDFFKSSRFL